MSDSIPRDTVLTAENVSAGYDDANVLHSTSLNLKCGEILGIVGPNGSGKSTLVRAITKVLRIRSGRITVGGDDIETLSARDLARRIAVVPQVAALPEGFTSLELALMGRTPYMRLLQTEGPADVRIARNALLQTDTLRFSERMPTELSGGERQRVIVARALTQESPILVLDEPTAHLDIGHQVGLLDLVSTLVRERELSVLAVVHDLTLAGQYCDRIMVLHEGAEITTGTPADVLRPEIVEPVYGVEVCITDHPRTGRPVVLTIPGNHESGCY